MLYDQPVNNTPPLPAAKWVQCHNDIPSPCCAASAHKWGGGGRKCGCYKWMLLPLEETSTTDNVT
jgi:hypothetical protein